MSHRILLLFGLGLSPLCAQAGWVSTPPGSASLNANVSVSATYQANPGSYPLSFLVIWAQSPSGTWTPVATGSGSNSSTINNSGSKTLDAAGTWNWQLRLANAGPSGSPAGTLLLSTTTTVDSPPTSTSFSFSNLSFTYDGSTKTASVTPNPGNATYTADLTKGPGVGSYTVSATATGSFTGSGSATLTINAAPDTSAPSTPGNVHVTAFDQSSVSFAWDAASDNVGVTGYQVRQNQGAPVTVSGQSHTFYGLANNTNYLLEVRAGDAAGNWSGWGGASASTGGSGGGGSGSGTSMWLDVDGDGIRDEVVKSGTDDFSHTIDWWYSTDPAAAYVQVNAHWNPLNIFNPDSSQWFTNFVSIWIGASYIAAPDRNSTTFGVTLTFVPRPGRQVRIMMDPTGTSTALPGNWDVIQPHMGPIGQSSFTFSQPFYTADSLDGTAFYLAHLGTPVSSLQFNDSLGNVLVNSVAVNSTANLFLPANGQITLGVFDTIGQAISTGVHNVVWKILDAVGNVLRQGTGLNPDFDGLDLSRIAKIAVVLDNAAEKSVGINASRTIYMFSGHDGDVVRLSTAPIQGATYQWKLQNTAGASGEFQNDGTSTWATMGTSSTVWFRAGTPGSSNVAGHVRQQAFGTNTIELYVNGQLSSRRNLEVLEIKPRSSWDAVDPHIGQLEGMSSLNGITIHHSSDTSDGTGEIKRIQNEHMSLFPYGMVGKNFADIGYHFIMTKDGTVFAGRAVEGWMLEGGPYVKGSHVENNNSAAGIGICMLGNYEGVEAFPLVRRMALEKALIAICRRYGLSPSVISTHTARATTNPTVCPGSNVVPKVDLIVSDVTQGL